MRNCNLFHVYRWIHFDTRACHHHECKRRFNFVWLLSQLKFNPCWLEENRNWGRLEEDSFSLYYRWFNLLHIEKKNCFGFFAGWELSDSKTRWEFSPLSGGILLKIILGMRITFFFPAKLKNSKIYFITIFL